MSAAACRVLLVIAAALLPARAAAQESAAAWMARADSAFEAGHADVARGAYRAVLDLEPSSSRALYQLGRLAPPGSERAIGMFRRYVALEPQDAWGHLALGDAYAAAARWEEALDAYAAATERAPEDEGIRAAMTRVAPRAEAARQARAPALGPAVRASRDSDGNVVLRSALGGSLAAGPARLGIEAARTRSADAYAEATLDEAALTLEWRRARTLDVTGALGAARTGGDAAETLPLLRMRARWRAPGHGPAAELRLGSGPIAATPLLLGTPVVLHEARGLVETPLTGALRARALGRVGWLDAGSERNRRTAAGGGLVLRTAPTLDLSAQYHRTRYDAPSAAGYFAPARIESIDVGAYGEFYGLWPLALAADLGGGVERFLGRDGAVGEWDRALRLWSLVSWTLRPGREIRLEVEGYDTLAGEALATEPGWRYGAASLAVRWAVR